jgi:hypothetical protein
MREVDDHLLAANVDAANRPQQAEVRHVRLLR